jgi:3-deoxy-D-manno-octulosonate 8-phosphate phosphatase (KDO 8-P phosphatase)
MMATDPLLRERAARIRLLVLDVDGVLTDGRLYFDAAGNEFKAFCTRDGLGIKALQRFGTQIAIITGRDSPLVEQRASQLQIDYVYQGSDDKLAAYMDLLEKSGVEEQQVCYAGDDWIDLPVLQRVGLAVTVPDADREVKERVHWVTENAGGAGAVREICDLILGAQGYRETLLQEFLDQ